MCVCLLCMYLDRMSRKTMELREFIGKNYEECGRERLENWIYKDREAAAAAVVENKL